MKAAALVGNAHLDMDLSPFDMKERPAAQAVVREPFGPKVADTLGARRGGVANARNNTVIERL